ncbi:MAG TPA: alpha/beta fold hydrolase [Thermoanaerobaculia bacterium]|nr:alpha/beta fold hydrolase [Thermoanaerobaculia bacterium]
MQYLTDGPKNAERTFVLAHGAGGPMDNAWMTKVARGLAEHGIRVVRFEFPYMAARRTGKKTGAPDRPQVLLDTWRNVITDLGDDLAIGGKSLGGRIASMVADEMKVRALVCFGYPFHPPGKPERTRTEHLEALRTRTLILQGERDPFGVPSDVASYKLSKSIHVEWIPDGDHSLKPRSGSGNTEASNLQQAVDLAAKFVR